MAIQAKPNRRSYQPAFACGQGTAATGNREACKRETQISFWNAMIVQAAESAGCEVLYSEDLSHRQRYGSVLVINPLLA